LTFEIKALFDSILKNPQDIFILASVVSLEGSSYRRPGVRMLVSSSNKSFGNISGGCVEKDIISKSRKVFNSGIPRIIKYDGTLRLGCEGVLTILLEPINLNKKIIKIFYSSINERKKMVFKSYFLNQEISNNDFGSVIEIDENIYPLRDNFKTKFNRKILYFNQNLKPIFKLLIFGAEHDAVELCKIASLLGWEVTVIAPPEEEKSIDFFVGASFFINPLFENIDKKIVDDNSAIILMTHSFSRDVQYLLALKETFPAYFGLLGPSKRREKIIAKFLDYYRDCSIEFLDQLRGPAGLDVGAESASEISISIISEILSVIRKKNALALSTKNGNIHD